MLVPDPPPIDGCRYQSRTAQIGGSEAQPVISPGQVRSRSGEVLQYVVSLSYVSCELSN